jgi:predicted TIM-barrel fold metal-dependent hydrolase
MTTQPPAELVEALDALSLVDHHVHGVARGELDRAALEAMITESFDPAASGTTWFDSPVGFAIRRHCAPVLDLAPHTGPDEYVRRRRELGAAEVNRRLLAASGVTHLLIDTGHRSDEITDVAETAAIAGQRADEVVRLEPVAEDLAAQGVGAGEFADAFATRLAATASAAVGLKSVVAYRFGLDFDPDRPSRSEVTAAAERWLRAGPAGERWRLDDPVLLRELIWTGLDLGLPLQFHVGYGDPDADLRTAAPLELRAVFEERAYRSMPVVLLHNCWPYVREGAYLASVYGNAWLDLSYGIPFLSTAEMRSMTRAALGVAPVSKLMYSSDGGRVPEIHWLSAHDGRALLGEALGELVDDGDLDEREARAAGEAILRGNACALYGLEGVRR